MLVRVQAALPWAALPGLFSPPFSRGSVVHVELCFPAAGEDGMDWGGVFRDAVNGMAEDLCSPRLDLMLLCPNGVLQDGVCVCFCVYVCYVLLRRGDYMLPHTHTHTPSCYNMDS